MNNTLLLLSPLVGQNYMFFCQRWTITNIYENPIARIWLSAIQAQSKPVIDIVSRFGDSCLKIVEPFVRVLELQLQSIHQISEVEEQDFDFWKWLALFEYEQYFSISEIGNDLVVSRYLPSSENEPIRTEIIYKAKKPTNTAFAVELFEMLGIL